ncbi:MAG: zinc ribbon domain-containing protein [Gemmatimonas sp.]|jgi:hypothetical protein|uniref:zinc ribbon domain-containing protein n=1 Tax=Gemmatimonas sp. TaxID=1962908 RepID=UPI0031C54D8E|nr:zinc ribbon domain-containing protein [Gemmatimonas sp.]
MALPEGALPLVLGTGLALGALTLVLAPLLSAIDSPTTPSPNAVKAVRKKKSRKGDEPSMAVSALREIEFDRETGKLSDRDYADLKQRYTRAALAELRAADAREGVTTATTVSASPTIDSSIDAVEAAIARAAGNVKCCGVCGPRPEPDAIYCNSCGRFLPGSCGSCGASVDLVGSRFCSGCGTQLAAA